jgi:hypothetical protein
MVVAVVCIAQPIQPCTNKTEAHTNNFIHLLLRKHGLLNEWLAALQFPQQRLRRVQMLIGQRRR